MFLSVKHCLLIGDEIPPGCEIQQMDYQGDVFGLLQTRHCFCQKAQCFDDAENKAHAVLCSIKRKDIKMVVKWSRSKIRLATKASGKK